MNKLDLITTRDFLPEDKAFIMATWLKGLYYGNSWFGAIRKGIYMNHYGKVLEMILSKPTIEIKVSCLKEDEDVILAYAVYEGDVLHWVHTKESWRNIGLAKGLIPSNITTVTHLNKVGRTLMVLKQLAFNPFLL